VDSVGRINTGATAVPAKQATAAPKQEQAKAGQPKDSFIRTVLDEAKQSAVKVGNITSSSVGGAIGLAGLTLGLYAGAAGGAIFLGALGAGIGPVLASVSTKGLLSFLGTSFATTGLMAKSAELIGKLPGMMIGGAIGLVTGTVHAIENKLGGGK